MGAIASVVEAVIVKGMATVVAGAVRVWESDSPVVNVPLEPGPEETVPVPVTVPEPTAEGELAEPPPAVPAGVDAGFEGGGPGGGPEGGGNVGAGPP